MRVTVKDNGVYCQNKVQNQTCVTQEQLSVVVGVELVSIRQCKNGIVCGLLQYRTDGKSYRDPVTGGKIPS